MPYWFYILNVSWIVLAIALIPLLLFVRAPYGRHSRKGWGPMIDNHWGWFWMELPALLIVPIVAFSGPTENTIFKFVLVAMWTLHYVNRTLIFPFRIKTAGKKMPLSIALSAVFFNGMNGFVNAYYLGYISSDNSTGIWLFLIGVFLFILGMNINIKADSKLIGLRKENKGYRIPHGGFFRYISCPNHFGEIVEWIGFAIAASNIAAIAFAIWTFSNLMPRSINHHAWYKEEFENYPKNRKALIPFIL